MQIIVAPRSAQIPTWLARACSLSLIAGILTLAGMVLINFNLRENYDLVMRFRALFIVVPLVLSLPIAKVLAAKNVRQATLLLIACPAIFASLCWAVAMQAGIGSAD